MKKILLSLIANLVIRTNCEQSGQNTVLWQGFRHKWEHKIAGFDTPHRMGSFGNAIINHQSNFNEQSQTWSQTAQINQTFVPGVNGDYAYPETFYTAIQSQNDNLQFYDQKVEFSFQDNIDQNGQAISNIIQPFQLLKSQLQNELYDQFPILNGFQIQMNCIQDNSTCNSDGAWPYIMEIDVQKSNEIDNFNLIFNFERSWTPGHGGGKANNPKMHYDVKIYLNVIQLKKSTFTVYDHKIQENSKKMQNTKQINGQVNINAKTNYTDSFIGIQNLRFELKNEAHHERGRYFEDIGFSVNSLIQNNQRDLKNSINFEYSMGVLAAKLTEYTSFVDYTMGVKIFTFDNSKSEQQQIITPKTQLSSKGEVCISDWHVIFSCKLKGLKEQTNDSEIVQISIQQTEQRQLYLQNQFYQDRY